MAHALGMTVVAEGVETAEQEQALRRIGCDSIQGFLLSPPTSPDEIDALFANGLDGDVG